MRHHGSPYDEEMDDLMDQDEIHSQPDIERGGEGYFDSLEQGGTDDQSMQSLSRHSHHPLSTSLNEKEGKSTIVHNDLKKVFRKVDKAIDPSFKVPHYYKK